MSDKLQIEDRYSKILTEAADRILSEDSNAILAENAQDATTDAILLEDGVSFLLTEITSVIDMTGAGIASGEAVGTPAVSATIADVGGIASAEAIGQPTVDTNAKIIGAGQIASAEAEGSPTISASVVPAGVASAEVVGSGTISVGITAAGLATAEMLGLPGVAVTTAAAGIATGGALGQPAVGATVGAASVTTAETIGAPALRVTVGATGIPTGEAIGQPTVGDIPAQIDGAGGIISAELFGNPEAAWLPDVAITEDAIEFWGDWVPIEELIRRLTPEPPPAPEPALVSCIGCPSAEAFGLPMVSVEISNQSLWSHAAFGWPTVKKDMRQIRERQLLGLLMLDD